MTILTIRDTDYQFNDRDLVLHEIWQSIEDAVDDDMPICAFELAENLLNQMEAYLVGYENGAVFRQHKNSISWNK